MNEKGKLPNILASLLLLCMWKTCLLGHFVQPLVWSRHRLLDSSIQEFGVDGRLHFTPPLKKTPVPFALYWGLE